jgi:hypothetical protein
MTPFLRQVFLFLVALAALAIVLMMVARAEAKELNQGSDGTRQIVVEETSQDKGAASTDLTAESGTPADTLASETPAPVASDESGTDSVETELTDREGLALAHLYALYLSAAQHGHRTYGYSYSHGYGRGYDHCDD